MKEHDLIWSQTPKKYKYRILIIGGAGSGKSNSLWNLIIHQQDVDNCLFIP